MPNSKFIARIAIAVIILPLLFLVIFIFKQAGFLALNIIILLFTLSASFEVANFFIKADIPVFRYSAPVLSATMCVVTYIEINYFPDLNTLTYQWLILAISFITLRTLFSSERKNFKAILPVVASSSFIIIYPGLFITYIIRILTLSKESPDIVFTFFILLVFSNEIMAYLFGKFLGQATKMNLDVSPNKTLVGFIAGFASSVITAAVFFLAFPRIFSQQANILQVMLFGSLIALTVIFGDLFESAIKRSANLKDSGTLMMGRGGTLDTLDSLLLSAPIFYLVFPFIS